MTARANRVAALLLTAAALLAGCGSAPNAPAYTEDELSAICKREMGWWHPNGLRGGYCERR